MQLQKLIINLSNNSYILYRVLLTMERVRLNGNKTFIYLFYITSGNISTLTKFYHLLFFTFLSTHALSFFDRAFLTIE